LCPPPALLGNEDQVIIRMQSVVDNRTDVLETVPSVHRSILVVGGGIAGITAAVEAAEAGYDVIIVEKEAYLWRRRPI
jgi:heterodisulfide reductase subunit A-like polyferredoxin